MHRASENDEYRRSAVDWLASLERQFAALKRSLDATPSPSPVSAPSPAGEDPRWQKLRDMLGLDGWHDGRFNGLPNPDQIVTHVQHVANERARLLLAPSPAGGVREAWRELCERDDRTSPEEYPDMCLITREELAEFMSRAALSSPATPEPVSVSASSVEYLLNAADDRIAHLERVSAPANGEAVEGLLARLADFDYVMSCHVGIGYFDGTDITKEWNHLVRPAMERLKAAPRADTMPSFSEWWAARDQSRHEWWSVQQWAEAAWKAAFFAVISNPAPGHGEGGL